MILSVGHLGYYSGIEPHQVPVSVLGDDTRTDVQDLQGGVVVKGHVVSRQQTLSFVVKLHLVLEDVVSWMLGQRMKRCIKHTKSINCVLRTACDNEESLRRKIILVTHQRA